MATKNETAPLEQAATSEINPTDIVAHPAHDVKALIEVRQLPIIAERLAEIRADIIARTEAVLAMPCTAETVKEIKKLRADLNRDFNELEKARKGVKAAVMNPYQEFESVYRDCVTSPLSSADNELKRRIREVEESQRMQKRDRLAEWIGQYRQSIGLPMWAVGLVGLNVTLSASEKSLRAEAQRQLDAIAADIKAIELSGNPEQLLAEYAQHGNLAEAMATIERRNRAEEAARQDLNRAAEFEAAEAEIVEAVEAVVPEEVFTVAFKATATKKILSALVAFMREQEIEFEQIEEQEEF